MNTANEWRIFNPSDPQTHPSLMALIDIKFHDGNLLNIVYLAGAGLFSKASGAKIIGTIERWRYSSAPDAVTP